MARISAKQKRCDLLSLIVCTDPCVYQQDGYCSLARAASCGSTGGSGCVNFVPRLQNGGQCFPDVGHPDHVQALRNRQLSLDPFRDQAFGKSQAPHLTEPLSQGTHRPQLAGQADLSRMAAKSPGKRLSRKLEAKAIIAARSAAGSSSERPPITFT